MGNVTRLTSPASTNACGVIVPVEERSAKLLMLTMAYSFRNGFVNPYFGTRRMRGIWPPSNPGPFPPPERANKPLCPLVAVFPWPEPGPRPIRLRFFLAPFAGARLCKFMMAALPIGTRLYESILAPEAYPDAPR